MNVHILDLNFLDSDHTIAAFLVETSEGPVLIESGPHSTLTRLVGELEKRGIKLSDLKHVLLTHIHLDHAGAAWALAEAGAKIYVHPVGAPHLIDPSRLMSSAKRIYQDQMDYLWGKMEAIPTEQVIPMGHGEKVRIGDREFTAWHTPGHAIHHIAWQVEDRIFCGDVAGVKIEEGLVVPPCPPPDVNLYDWENSLELLKELEPKRLYLTHFGSVNHCISHLDELHARMWEWAHWVKARFEAGKTAGEISGSFQEFVEQELLSKGVPESSLVQYNKANPPFMSVVGLMRFWKKEAERQAS